MKKSSAILVGVLLLTATAMAAGEPVQGKKVEFSTAFALSVQTYNFGSDYKETDTYITTPFRLGIFIWKGLEFEPELLMMMSHYKQTGPGYSDSGHQTAWILSGNLVYNFVLKKSPRMIPFVLAGYGIGNGDYEPAWDTDTYYGTSPKDSLFNLGAGIKYMFGNIAALRCEYRFRGGQIKYTTEGGAGKDKVYWHTILVGFSIFF